MFSEILERFIKGSPVAVMVRALLENLLNADKIDQWFEGVRQTQYTKEILFSSIVGLMLQVVCKIRPSVHGAYPHSGITASVVAVYDKLKNLELTTAQGLVRHPALLRSLGPLRGPCFRRCFYKFSRRYMRMSLKLCFLHWRFFRASWMFLILFQINMGGNVE